MPLTPIRQLSVKSEADLERMLAENPAAIEEGLRILETQVPASRGFIDLLAVDADGAITVIELKKDTDDRILSQALEYYDFVRDNTDRFAQIYRDHKINLLAEPRLLLIAATYTPMVLAAARYTNVPLALYTYSYLGMGEAKGLYLTEVDITPPRQFGRERKPVDQWLAYVTDETANRTCQTVLDWLRALDPSQVRTHGLKYRISVKYKGNNFVDIHPRRSYFVMSWRPAWDESHRIAMPADFSEEIKQQLKQSFIEMGGLPPDTDAHAAEEEA